MIPDEARITEAQSESLHNALIASCDEFVPPIHLPDEARIAALEAENARLREALAPFAKEADAWWSELPDEARPWIAEPGNVGGADAEFSLHDLRRARAALGEGGGDA